MVKVLLIGNGAREHSIAEAILRSPQKPELYSYLSSRNPGITKMSNVFEVGSYDDIERIKTFAKKVGPDFCVVGPEAPLDFGVVDALAGIGIPSVGPTKHLSRLETSKSFTRMLMEKYKIPGLPKFQVFTDTSGLKDFIQSLDSFVVKPDGLTGGKGVKVHGEHLKDSKDAVKYCGEVFKTHPAVVIEEKLEGEEFSLQSFTDGKHVLDSPPAQDHKRAYDGDQGPNTGGMGSYSCSDHLLPFLEKNDMENAHRITVYMANAIRKETGTPYQGVMYGGFILTKEGVKLIEYNARLGDPEAMNVLPILSSDFVDICYGIINGNLEKVKAKFENKSTVCKYIVPKGYPANPARGERIEVSPLVNANMYFASVDQKPDGLYMSGSRAIAFVGISEKLDEAERIAQQALGSVKGNVFFRKDIGTMGLIQRRIEHMKMLKGI
ncbi:MAG: phosphoribosylamine--glycine ligase [Candidatus Aenigmarchaeota archaeon]|nr:phosphoribosylamine--glycine ligase [Candidatus Aenigmarchaeota archaeon]